MSTNDRTPSWIAVLSLLLSLLILVACSTALPEAAPGSAEDPTVPAPATEAPADRTEPEVTTPTIDTPAADLPEGVANLRDALARQLQIDPATVTVVEYEAVDWPDACLGAVSPDEMCAQVITPGYRIVLESGADRYVIHADVAGNNFRIVEGPAPEVGAVILDWEGNPVMGDCQNVTFGDAKVAFGPCGTTLRLESALDFGNRSGELDAFRNRFASFVFTNEAGTFTFEGQGDAEASPSEQRMIAEWAQMVALEAPSGRTSAANGLLLAVLREGEALCTNISIYLSGVAYLTDCESDPPLVWPALQLDADQLDTLYGWYDGGQPFEAVRSEESSGESVAIFFAGRGLTESTAEVQLAMDTFTAEVAGQASAAADPVAVAAPAVAASAVDAPSGCPQPEVGSSLVVSEAHGYCLLIPDSHAAVEYAPDGTAFVAGGDLMNTLDARLELTVVPAEGATAQSAADARMAEVQEALPGWIVDTEAVELGGEAAVELRELPGQSLQRVIYVVHDDRLFTFALTPDDPAVTANAGMLTMRDLLLTSFHFTR